MSLIDISFSRMFEKAGSILIGLQLLNKFWSPDLKIGITRAIFKSSGTRPVVID